MTLKRKKKIIITDDHQIVRKGVVEMINESPFDADLIECSNGAETFVELERNSVDMLLLDISLPGESGIEVFKRVRLLYPDLSVLFITMFSNSDYVKLAVRLGAAGYIVKDSSIDQMAFALQEVFAGRRYFGGNLLLQFFDDEEDRFLKEHDKLRSSLKSEDINAGNELNKLAILSKREREVFMGLAQGRLTKEIAYDLNLSSKTISTYRNRILEKLDLKNNAEMVSYAIRENILKGPK